MMNAERGTSGTRAMDHHHTVPRARPVTAVNRILSAARATLLLLVLLSTTPVQCAVPFASGHADGSSSMVPLFVIILLAYCARRIAVRAVMKSVPGNTAAPGRH